MTGATYEYAALQNFATALGERAGLPADRANVQAEILLEADLMGHTTHGLAMLPGFLKSIESGAIRCQGRARDYLGPTSHRALGCKNASRHLDCQPGDR